MNDKFIPRGYCSIRDTLLRRISEPAPSLIQLLVGPRQVGKTTLLLELADTLGPQAIYVACDTPEASLPGWRDRLWQRVREQAARSKATLLLDEIQAVSGWSAWLKSCMDQVKRQRVPLHIVATGSSSLRLGAGARESMAGRFERHVLPQWSARNLHELLDVPANEAPARLVALGGYPGAVRFWNDPDRWRSYIRDAIIEPAIGRDILQLEQVRKPALLRQVFALATAHPAEILSLDKIAGALAERGALETIAHYLDLLKAAFLVAPTHKYSDAEIRRRRSPPKLVVLDNALLAATSSAPDPRTDTARWGRWVENACLAHAIHQGEEVFYWREEPWEVDGVFVGPRGRWLVEVKTGAYTQTDLRGLAQAAIRFPKFKPLVLCDRGCEAPARAAGFAALAWDEFLFGRWPGE